jgi:uncharacterized protein (TIGR03083 family)
MTHELAQLMEQSWSSFEEVCSQLDPPEWELPTDCPGWTVKDQLSHINAIESIALGRRAPGEPIWAPHVRNDLGAMNELEIEHRRSRTPAELLDELREVTGERGKVIASWTDDEWKQEGQGVLGVAPREKIIGVRVTDVFTHEQDVRVATGRPGHLGGDVARFVYGEMVKAMGYALVKRAKATEGQSVLFEIGPPGGSFAVVVKDGRGVPLEPLPDDPTVTLAMDFETFLRLTVGRWSPKRLIDEGRLRVSGDPGLAERMPAGINIMV